METNVSGLLRDFPQVKRAALAGERVRIHTREGDLILTADRPSGNALFGCLKGQLHDRGMDPDQSGIESDAWEAGL